MVMLAVEQKTVNIIHDIAYYERTAVWRENQRENGTNGKR